MPQVGSLGRGDSEDPESATGRIGLATYISVEAHIREENQGEANTRGVAGVEVKDF